MSFLKDLIQYCLVLPVGCALCGTGVQLTMSQTPSLSVPMIIFLSLFAVYALDRVLDGHGDDANHAPRSHFFSTHRQMFLSAAIAAQIASFVIAWTIGWAAAGLAILPLISVFFYSIGANMRISRGRLAIPKLKKILGVKNAIVSATLTSSVVLLPAVSGQSGPDALVVFLWSVLFLRIAINNITFDIRDITGDISEGVRTIPATLGKQASLNVLHGINIVIGIMLLLAVPTFTAPALCLLVTCLYTGGYLQHIQFHQASNVFYDVLVDGEFALWGVLLIIAYML